MMHPTVGTSMASETSTAAVSPATGTELAKVLAPDYRLPPPPTNEEVIWKIRNRLGLPEKKWDRVRMMGAAELGKVEDLKLVANVLVIGGLDSIEKIQRAMEVATDLMEKPGTEDQTRVAAGQMIANCGKAMRDLAAQVIACSEKGADKKDLGPTKPKNLPPSVAVQVNNYPGTAANAPLNGKTVSLPDGATKGVTDAEKKS